MFNRSRSLRDNASYGAAAATFDEVLTDLEDATPPAAAASYDPTPTVAAAVEHTDTLRATRDAQQQAQEMLVIAARSRNAAADQAEQILMEARAAADRIREEADRDAERNRRETADWVAAQRARVDAAVAEVTEAAARDAEAIRAEAMRTAMAEAEESARRYVGEAASRGARDAEEIRASARDVLSRATELANEVETTARGLTSAVEETVAELHARLRAAQQVAQQAVPQAAPQAARKAVVGTEQPDPAAGGSHVDPAAAFRPPPPPADPLGMEPHQLGAMFRDTQPRSE